MKSILSHKEYYHVLSTCAVVFFMIWLGLFGIRQSGIEVSPTLRRYLYIVAEFIFVAGAIMHYSAMGKEHLAELEREYPITEHKEISYSRIDDNPFK